MTSHQGQSIKDRRGIHGPPVPQIWCNSDYYLQSYGMLKKNGTRHFSLIGRHLESFSRTIPVFKHTLAPSEKWPTQEISVRFGPFLSSYRVNITRCNLCARAKVKGHIKLKIEENTPWENWSSHFKFGSCTSFRFMGYGRQKWHSFFQQLAAILNVPFRPNCM